MWHSTVHSRRLVDQYPSHHSPPGEAMAITHLHHERHYQMPIGGGCASTHLTTPTRSRQPSLVCVEPKTALFRHRTDFVQECLAWSGGDYTTRHLRVRTLTRATVPYPKSFDNERNIFLAPIPRHGPKQLLLPPMAKARPRQQPRNQKQNTPTWRRRSQAGPAIKKERAFPSRMRL